MGPKGAPKLAEARPEIRKGAPKLAEARPEILLVRCRPLADAAVAAIVLGVTLLTTRHVALGVTAVALATAACATLVARRRFPLTVLIASGALAEGYIAMFGGDAGMLVMAAPLIALYTVAEAPDRRSRMLTVAGVVMVVFGVFHIVMRHTSWIGPDNLAFVALGARAVAAGDATRSRRAHYAEAERQRAQEARRMLTDERLRIARDLHDSVGHHLAMINVQAGVAAHVIDDRPDAVRQALTHIREAGRGALDELRDSVGLLREPGEPLAVEPTASLAALDGLLASFRRCGLGIISRNDGKARSLPRPVEATAFRVIQESLTNACKHAPGAAVDVLVSYGADALRVQVTNDSRTGPMGRDGSGIVGMRERVAAIGGRLDARPRSNGAFRVEATLPL
jgi:signal transduction histidine kinase